MKWEKLALSKKKKQIANCNNTIFDVLVED